IGVAVILGAERNRLTVRRKNRIRLDADVARQTTDIPAIEITNPQIIRVNERYMFLTDSGLAQEPRVIAIRLRAPGPGQDSQQDDGNEETVHGVPPEQERLS